MRFVPFTAALAVVACAAVPAFAASLATDDASNQEYDDGIQNGDNGGDGFLPFAFIGNVASSGAGGTFTQSGNTDIGTGTANEAFGIFGNGGGTGQAVRPFDGALEVGQTFSIAMDNASVDGDGNGPGSDGKVGFGLQNNSGTDRVQLFFTGGLSNYLVNDSLGNRDTQVPFTTGGLNLSITLTAPEAYSIEVTPIGGSTTTLTGTLAGPAGTGIDRVRLLNANGGGDVAFNSLAVVPEPLTALGGTVLLGLVTLRRRRTAEV